MKLPQIRLSQTYAQIGLRIERPKQQIQQPKAKLDIQQKPARLEIQRDASQLRIDQTKAWEEVNLKGIDTLAKDWATESRRQLMDGIARRAEEGKELAAIERGGNSIADLSKRNSAPPPKRINIAFVPSYGSVTFEYLPSKLNISWHQGGATVHSEIQKPIHEYAPGKVDVYIRQRESLSIDFTGLDIEI